MSEHTPVAGWSEPTAAERLDILHSTRTVAYEVYFANPTADEILGRPCVPSLADLPVVPDLVDVFRRLDGVPGVAEESVAVGAKAFWTQFGLWSPKAARIALDGGLDLVMDRCLKVEHARFNGGLHLAGFDTGVIDSRRKG